MDLGFAVTGEADDEWGDDGENETKLESAALPEEKPDLGAVTKKEHVPTTISNTIPTW